VNNPGSRPGRSRCGGTQLTRDWSFFVSDGTDQRKHRAALYTSFGGRFATWWLPASALPYFALYARDLHQAGYRYRDVVAAYALNLLLVPTNLAGVAKSVVQVMRRTKTPFMRTPKVEGRTPAPRRYQVAAISMLAMSFATTAWDLAAGRYAHAGFAFLNGLLLAYAITVFIGWRSLLEDLRTWLSI
jgi:cellulose synthase (UDP-forming)